MRKCSICFILFLTCLFFTISCRRAPIKSYKNIKGYVIGKETCHSDNSKDYWLIDFTYWADMPHVGDTLMLSGTTYTNVLKTTGLIEPFKRLGLPLSIEYEVITSTNVSTTGCDVVNPVTYSLKELFVINQFEIR